MRIVTAVAVLVCCVSVGIVRGEDSENNPTAKLDARGTKTIVYIARNSPANSLSAAIAAFLEGTDSRVTSEVVSNVLLVQTSEANQQRVIEVLQHLDRAPHTLRIQIHLLTARGESLAELDTASLSGPTDSVLESIKSLESQGRVHVANRIALTTVENQIAMLQFGETVPVVTGAVLAPGSRSLSNNYRNLDVGTMLTVETRVSGDSHIVLTLDFEKSSLEQPSAEAGEEARPTRQGVSRLTHQSTARIQDGHSLLIGRLLSRSTDGDSEQYLVLSAAIAESKSPKQVAKLQSSPLKPAPKARSTEANRAADATSIDSRVLAYYEKLLDKYDQNKDKALDADERSNMSKDCSAADTDKNGLVTVEEFTAFSMKR